MKNSAQIFLFILLGFAMLYLSCKKELSCENCATGKINKSPKAIAGPDQIIFLPADSISLDGSISYDPDGTIVSYKWTKISGPSSANILKTDSSKTPVKSLIMGVYKFELTVKDNGGLSAKDTMMVIVNDPAVNQPPIANAGTDQTITLPMDSVLLNGNLSFDPDGTIVSYQWVKISGPAASNIFNPTFVQTKVDQLQQGVYQFELKVTDNGNLTGKDTVQLTVNPASSNNLPPVAKAGQDINVNYDLQTCNTNPISITLDGSTSFDPDGTIVSYLWTGPGTIVNPNAAITQVNNLFPGTNTFTLKVTDNTGATGQDTMHVNVINLLNRPLVTAQLTPFANLPFPGHYEVAAAADKLVFISQTLTYTGGTNSFSRPVHIYNMTTQAWATTELSNPRMHTAITTLGNKIFFAGGSATEGNNIDTTYATVDIYDAAANTWAISSLNFARNGDAAVTLGNKIFVACNDIVQIYNQATNSWSSAGLSEARWGLSAVDANNKVYFAGGFNNNLQSVSNRVDVYDNTSNAWSQFSLMEPKSNMAGIVVGSKIFWAGGYNAILPQPNLSGLVQIYDASSQTSTSACLFQLNGWNRAVLKDNKIVFFTGNGSVKNKFDIYDISTSSWSIGILPYIMENAAIITYNNVTYVAGGLVNGVYTNQVYKLEF
ncbi:MAG: hypothetical protein ABIT81_05650 [Ferruginibacter sp.]